MSEKSKRIVKIPESVLNRVSVLVVDDTASMRKLAYRMLNELGFRNIVEAVGVEDSLSILEDGFSGIVIADLNLRDGKAYDLIRRARYMKSQRSTPFLIVTSDVDLESNAKLHNVGIVHCLLKPFSAQTLGEEIIRSLVGSEE